MGRSLTCVLVFIFATPLWAMEPIPGEERFEALQENKQNEAGFMLGFGQLEEDYFLEVTPQLDLNFGKLGLGLRIPLNLRVWDRDPKETEDDYFGVIRRQDWDEPSEFLRVIRYARWGQKRDTIYARVGELAAEIGHGTIMSRYMNNLDINTFSLGAQLDVNTNYGGVETIVSDLGALYANTPETRLIGGRLYFKPVAIWDAESIFNIFSVGTTVITDINAPAELERDAAGAAIVDGNENLVVARESAATVYGFDVEAAVLDNSLIRLVPYIDFNVIDKAGWGLHMGAMAKLSLAVGFDLSLPVRAEYRRFRSDYLPIYFSTFYGIERYTYPVQAGDAAVPKIRAVRSTPSDDGINGYYADAAFDFAGLLQIGAIYEDYEGANPDFAAFLSVPALEWLQLKAYYARTDVKGPKDVFKLDERSMAIAEARYEIISYLFLVGRWTRRWTLATEGTDKGTFQPEDSWKVGLEAGFTF